MTSTPRLALTALASPSRDVPAGAGPCAPRRALLLAAAGSLAAGCSSTPPSGPSATPASAAPLPPEAYSYANRGWALNAVGGRGGRLIRVTTLAADGPGSLRAAVEASGPRIVVFEVGGTIDLGGRNLVIKEPQLTIAGQTAPSPGISVIKAEITISTHDVVIQHLRIRPGEYGRAKRSGGDMDGITTLSGARDLIVDHCSLSWATDENLSASGPRFNGATPDDWRRATAHRITYSNNLVYEGLSHSVHEKGEHSKGTLIHDNATGVLIYRNVYVSNRERNPLFKGGARGAIINNLVFNPGTLAMHYNLWAREWEGQPYQTGRLAVIGNVLRHGPDTATGTGLFTMRGHGDLELHAADNLAFDRAGATAPLFVDRRETQPQPPRVLALPQPDLPPGLALVAAAAVEQQLPRTAGARPWDRDAIDTRLLRELAAGRGRIIDSEAQVGGYAVQVATRRAFDPAQWHLDDMSPRAGWSSITALTQPQA